MSGKMWVAMTGPRCATRRRCPRAIGTRSVHTANGIEVGQQDARGASVTQTEAVDWRDVARITATEAQARIDAGEALTVVDVRRPTARRGGHIVGDVVHPRRSHRDDPPLPRDRTLVLY